MVVALECDGHVFEICGRIIYECLVAGIIDLNRWRALTAIIPIIWRLPFLTANCHLIASSPENPSKHPARPLTILVVEHAHPLILDLGQGFEAVV